MGIVLNWSSGYPASIDDLVTNFPAVADNTHDVLASHVNELASAVVALQAAGGGFRTTAVADPLSPSNGDVLFYNSGSGEWEAGLPSTLTVALQDAYDDGAGVTLAAGTPIALTTSGAGQAAITVTDGGSTVTIRGDEIQVPAGSAAAPSILMGTATPRGFFSNAVHEIGVSTNSVERMKWKLSEITFSNPLRGADGSLGTPTYSFGNRTSVGMYLGSDPGVPELGLAVEGIAVALFRGVMNEATGDEVFLDMNGTVNKATSGNYTGIRLDVTETAAPGTDDRLLDLRTGGTERWYVDNVGRTLASTGSAPAPGYAFTTDKTTGFYLAGGFRVSVGGTGYYQFGTTQFSALDDGGRDLGFSSLRWKNFYLAGQSINTVSAATGDEVLFDYNGTVNKATSGSYTGIKLDVTETAAPGTDDRLLDLQVASVSQLYVSNSGQIAALDGAVGAPSYTFGSALSSGMYLSTTNTPAFATNGTVVFSLIPQGSLEMQVGREILLADGSVGAPGLSFSQGTQEAYGLWSDGSGNLKMNANSSFQNYLGGIHRTTLAITSWSPNADNAMDLGTAGQNWRRLYVNAGAVATPSVAVGETAQGLYSPATDQVAMSTAAAQIQLWDDQNPTLASGVHDFVTITGDGTGLTGTAGYTLLTLNMSTDGGGSGAERLLDLQVGGVSQLYVEDTGAVYVGSALNRIDANQGMILQGNITTGNNNGVSLQNFQAFTGAAAATQVGVAVTHTINQTSTAAMTSFMVNRTETAVGSGEQLLMDLQVGGTTMFNVENNGQVNLVGALDVPASGFGVVVRGNIDGNQTNRPLTILNSAGAFVGSSVEQQMLRLAASINQTSTAGFVNLDIDRTETALGSGNQMFIRMHVGGSEKAYIDNAGKGYFLDEVEIDGDLNHDGSNIGFYGTTPAAQSAAYSRTATVVESRVLAASASASATNNNNVLAALIADLQNIGIIG